MLVSPQNSCSEPLTPSVMALELGPLLGNVGGAPMMGLVPQWEEGRRAPDLESAISPRSPLSRKWP